MAATTTFTIEDFERLPADMAKNHELVDGELIDVSGNTPIHNLLRGRLELLLRSWADERKAGTVISEQEYDFLGNAHGPDVTFFGDDERPRMDLRKRVQRFVPDLAVEIASESDTYDAMLRKKDRYLRAGTVEVWLISTATREITIYGRGQARVLCAGDTLSSELLPGFSVVVDEAFPVGARLPYRRPAPTRHGAGGRPTETPSHAAALAYFRQPATASRSCDSMAETGTKKG